MLYLQVQMNLDPHTLKQILERIHSQMRCPQCSRQVDVNLSDIKVVSDGAMLLELKCEDCNAYVVLQASLKGIEDALGQPYDEDETANKSTTLGIGKDDLKQIKMSLENAGGSFESLFESNEVVQSESDIQK